MVNKLSSVRQLTPINPMGKGTLQDHPDHGGGYMDSMTCQKVSVPAGGSAKASMIDGPYGGKVKA